jgi:glucose-1-phosphate adenylyltransferase
MGVYVFSKRALRRWLSEDRNDFGRDVVPAMLEGGARVFGYHFDGYWQDVGTIQSYWEANLALLEDRPELDLYDRDWTIHTRSEERAPAQVGPTAQVHRSMISHGCVINGTVVNSVLSPGVRVDVGAVVRDSIVMFDSVIRSGAVVDRSILDKEVVVGPGAIVGDGPDFDTPNRQEPGRLNTGITVVGKRAIIPRGERIGRNVKVAGDVRATDFASKIIRNGASVEANGAKPRKKKSKASSKADEAAEGRAARAEAAPRSEAATTRTNGSGTGSGIPIAGSVGRMTAKPRGEH